MDDNQRGGGDLERTVTLPRLIFYGVGTILGAGIFVVIGEIIGASGPLAPLAYLAAGIVAFTTALSYAEISARVPTAGGPVDYVEEATGIRSLGSAVGWMLMVANTVSAATITTGFISYLGLYVEFPDWVFAVLLVSALGGLAMAGMRQSTWFMTATTLTGIVTLIAVLIATSDGLVSAPARMLTAFDSFDGAAAAGVFAAAFLAIYSFIGFGDMALTAEEVVDVRKTLPRAIIFALAIVFVFYLLVSTALIGVLPTDRVANADAPLVAAVERTFIPGWVVWIGSLFVIVNGALTQIIGAARLLYDNGRDGRGAPTFFGKVSPRTGTPLFATAAIAVIVLVLAVLVPLKSLAEATSFAILLVFFAVNVALILLKRRSQPEGVPDVTYAPPALGAAACIAALGFQSLQVFG